MADDPQDLDGTERGAETAKGRELVRIDLWHPPMMPVAHGRGDPAPDCQIRSLGAAGNPTSSWKGSAAQESRPLRSAQVAQGRTLTASLTEQGKLRE
jgi:hypothetical protein